jgi:hypothetical protein
MASETGLLNDDGLNAQLTERATALASSAAKSKAAELKEWITKGPLALKVLAFGANVAALVVVFIELFGATFSLKLFTATNDVYIVLGCLVGVMLEVKPCLCTRNGQRRVAFWCRVLSRVQGRGIMYILLGLMMLARDNLGIPDWVCGFALIGVGVFSFLVSFWAKRKIQKIHTALVAGHENDPQAMQAAFDRYDTDGNGSLSASELALVASSLGAEFSKNELVAVFDLLDRDNSGDVSFEEFSRWWLGDKEVDYSLI